MLHASQSGPTILDDARAVSASTHVDPLDQHERIARMWEGFLGLPEGFIGPRRAALMLGLVKIAGEAHGDGQRADRVGLAAYADITQRIVEREAEVSEVSARVGDRVREFLRRNAEERAQVRAEEEAAARAAAESMRCQVPPGRACNGRNGCCSEARR